MRLPAFEKLEIIRLVEQSHLPARRTLQMLGIKPSTFYRWYDRFRSDGPEALEDKAPKPDRVWNRIPDDVRQRVVMMAFEQPELSPRELATRFYPEWRAATTAVIAECAENARQCKWYASKTNNAEERKFLLRMAKRWSELAAEKEREVLKAAQSAALPSVVP